MSGIVKVGLWTDYHRGSPVLSKVVTVDYRTGAIIVTLSTILVTLAANRSWKLWRLLLHTFLSMLKPPPNNEARLHQTILRNSETTGGALLSFFETFRQTPRKTKTIGLALIIFTLLHWGCFIALGLLTTTINLGSMVLSAKTESCGLWDVRGTAQFSADNVPSFAQGAVHVALGTNSTIAAENYARNCYGTDATHNDVSDCNFYPQQSLAYTTESAPCPFLNTDLCIAPEHKAFAMDTRNMTFSDLGINWKHAKDVTLRRRTVCSPIDSTPFIYDRNASYKEALMSLSPGADPTGYWFYSFTTDPAYPGRNFTYPVARDDASLAEYDVNTVMAENGSWVLDALKPHAMAPELSFVTMRGRMISFPEPCDDPFFSAHRESNQTVSYTPLHLYFTDHALNTLACQDMAMVCSALTAYCSDWISPRTVPLEADRVLGPSYKDDNNTQAAFGAVSFAAQLSNTYTVLNNRGASALQATASIYAAKQVNVGPEQWKVEAEHWFKTSLALLQMFPHRLVYTPGLPLDRVENLMDTSPDMAGFSHACDLVKFRSSRHMSLSFAGLLLVVVLSAALTALSYLDVAIKRFRPDLLVQWEHNSYLYMAGHGKDDGDDQVHDSKVHLYTQVDGSHTSSYPEPSREKANRSSISLQELGTVATPR